MDKRYFLNVNADHAKVYRVVGSAPVEYWSIMEKNWTASSNFQGGRIPVEGEADRHGFGPYTAIDEAQARALVNIQTPNTARF